MIGNTYSIRFGLPVSVVMALLAAAAAAAQAGQSAEAHPDFVEIFTTTELPVASEAVISQQTGYREIEFHVYELDGVQRIEAKLSKGLSADPEQSKRVVLQHFQKLHEEDRASMQRAAMGLAKVAQYGIDRYPAIVFDGELAIYGVTDIGEALHRYQQWQAGRTP